MKRGGMKRVGMKRGGTKRVGTKRGFATALSVWLAIAVAVTATAASPAHAQGATRVQADLTCVMAGASLEIDCTVRLRRGGQPLDGAQVTLGATMPSMPMAHSVRPAPAKPTGRTPGEYLGRLDLEMTGVWAVQIDVSGPTRDRIVRRIRLEDCPQDRRCEVASAEQPKP
jgi:hypothetical protein